MIAGVGDQQRTIQGDNQSARRVELCLVASPIAKSPAIAARQRAHFARRVEPVGMAMAVVWLGENLLNVARYMADARAQELPLVGGGEHDWTEIFLRWGVLAKDVKIAGFTRWLGVALMVGAVFWLWRRYQENEQETR